MNLAEFLLARIAEDEAAAAAAVSRRDGVDKWEAVGSGTVVGPGYDKVKHVMLPSSEDGAARHIARHDPARVLAECEAKRRIVAEAFEVAATIDGEWGCCHDADDIRRGYREPTPGWGDEAEPLPEGCAGPEVAGKFLQALAAVYAGHEDYRQEWKP